MKIIKISQTSWKYTEDPYGEVPVGYHNKRQKYTVMGFSAPAGLDKKYFMVDIEYDNGKKTTKNYLDVLNDIAISP